MHKRTTGSVASLIMEEKINKHQHILQVLRTSSPQLRRAILKECDDAVIVVLVEIILNLLQGHIPTTPHAKRQLNKFKMQFRNIVKSTIQDSKCINKRKARKIMIQHGGFLPFLLPLIAPLAKAALGGIVAASAGALTKKIIT